MEIKERVIRVFISSTFRDMQEEREELVKRIFPQLRKICEERQVVWGEVDLRWGVTDEEKAEGRVLPICLEEIRHCRPYFIGLLGQRYGWIPHEIPQELIEREPWLKEHLHHSVTELEILHGVLNNPEMAAHAYFYFRDPAYIDTLPPGKKADYLSESHEFAEKLRQLKERIRKSPFPVRENYPGPESLGELVLKDLTALINRLYPEGSLPDPLEREAIDHDIFAQSRARVYIGRKEYFDKLDSHVSGDGPPLVILGESGSGKSALLSNWALNYKKRHAGIDRTERTGLWSRFSGRKREAEPLLIMHFIGGTPASTDWVSMLRRIMGEFKRRFDISEEIPSEPDKVRSAFVNWLHIASARGRTIIILDALNQLEDRDRAPDLVWLPPAVPKNVRLIVSTLPGRPLEELEKRGWHALKIEPLNPGEREEFIEEYLGQYSKRLSEIRIRRIVSVSQTANPLYLHALLEELRQFGEHDKIDRRIEYYLQAEGPSELYRKILARWEEDYGKEVQELVRNSMTLVWASRMGLSESELLDLLGTDGNPLPRAGWAPFSLAAGDSLVNRSGLLDFFHDYLRQAVHDLYLSDDHIQKKYHIKLADYFEKKDITPRKADELPWQLTQAKEWERLKDCISNIEMFLLLSDKEYELHGYWLQLEGESNIYAVITQDVAKEYRKSLMIYEATAPKEKDLSNCLNRLGNFLLLPCGRPEDSEPLYRRALIIDEKSLGPDHLNVARDLYNLAVLLRDTNRVKEAEPMFRRALEISVKRMGPNHLLTQILRSNYESLHWYADKENNSVPAFVRKKER